MQFQICKTCHKKLPATKRYFFISHKDKLRINCKKCSHGNSYGLRTEYKPPLAKICSSCKIEYKNNENFFFKTSNKRKDGTDCLMAHCKTCRIEASKDRVQKWREKNREQYLLHASGWKKKNREKSNLWEKEYRNNNPSVALRRNISAQMGKAIREQKRGLSWEKILGYTLNDLIEHLESLFCPGMNWKNYSKTGWHIDHIRPLSSFTISSIDDSDFRECWALGNLQPLWAKDNLRKGTKYEVPS